MYDLTRYRKVTFAILTGVLLVCSFVLALPFWHAIAWGAVLGLISFPLHKRFKKRFSNNVSALLTSITVTLAIALPLVLIIISVSSGFRQIQSNLKSGDGHNKFSFSQAADDANDFLKPVTSAFGIEQFDVRETARSLIEPALSSAPQTIERLIKDVIVVIFAFILLYFLLRDGHKLRDPVLELIPMQREKAETLLANLYETLHATFQGIVFVAAIQGLLLGITFWALGLPAPALAGLFGFFLCMIPFAGAPVLWVPSAIVLALQDKWVEAAVLVIAGVFVIGLVDNFVRPIIIGARTRLHTAAVFFAIIGGLLSLGSIGVFIGPLLITACLGVADILRDAQSRTEVQNP